MNYIIFLFTHLNNKLDEIQKQKNECPKLISNFHFSVSLMNFKVFIQKILKIKTSLFNHS